MISGTLVNGLFGSTDFDRPRNPASCTGSVNGTLSLKSFSQLPLILVPGMLGSGLVGGIFFDVLQNLRLLMDPVVVTPSLPCLSCVLAVLVSGKMINGLVEGKAFETSSRDFCSGVRRNSCFPPSTAMQWSGRQETSGDGETSKSSCMESVLLVSRLC